MIKKFLVLGLGFFFLYIPNLWAAPPPVGGGKILPGPVSENPGEGTTAGSEYLTKNLAPGITNTIILFILSVSVLMIVIGGILYIASSGDSEKAKKAKDTITWAIIGVALAVLSYAIVKFFIGINFSGA